MILCIDVGNSNFFCGLFQNEKLLLNFRYPSTFSCTSDQLGVFFKNVLRENEFDPHEVKHVAICSVVPSLNHSVHSAFIKYFNIEPFLLTVRKNIGLEIDYKNPDEIGADRIANAVAVSHLFPGKNSIIVDLGTATTFDIVSAGKTYVGGVITSGMQTAMKALYQNTAKLPAVDIIKPTQIAGKTTIANIQSGLYFGHLGAIRSITEKIKQEIFANQEVQVIGTGGFSNLFSDENIFQAIIPDLVLQGLRIAYERCRLKS